MSTSDLRLWGVSAVLAFGAISILLLRVGDRLEEAWYRRRQMRRINVERWASLRRASHPSEQRSTVRKVR